MATTKKTTAEPVDDEQEQPVAKVIDGPAPEHANVLCGICGVSELHPSTTTFTCEHGTWTFTPAAVAALADPVDAARAALAKLDPDARAALLAEA